MRVGVLSCKETTCTPAESNPTVSARKYSSVFNGHAIGTGLARSALDSAQAWSAATESLGEHMVIDLGSPREVKGVVTQSRADAPQWVTTFTVEESTDGSTWKPVGSTFNGPTKQSEDKISAEFPAPITTRYVK